MTEFEKHLPLVTEMAAMLERWRLREETVSIRAIARGLNRPLTETYQVFDLLGLVPAAWSEPERYRVADILEATTRHEVAARFNR